MKKHQFSICDWKLPITGSSSLEIAKYIGYDGIQILDMGGASRGFPLCMPWVQDHYKRIMAETGVVIDTLQPNNIIETGQIAAHPDSPLGRQGLLGVQKAAEACKALGIPRIQLESMDTSHLNHIQTQADLENAAAFLRASAEILDAYSVRLTYESFASVAETMELYARSENSFKLCYDTMNPIGFGFGDPTEELPIYFSANMIDFIHFKDTPEGGKLGTALLGTGIGKYNQCLAIIRQFGYTGWLVTENHYGWMGTAADPFAQMKMDLRMMKLSV